MYLFSIFLPGCPPLICSGGLRFGCPVHYFAAWAIVVCAVSAVFFPFLAGYRLGERVPYSITRHLGYALLLTLFPFVILFLASGPSFGTFLLTLLYLPCEYLIALTAETFRSLSGRKPFPVSAIYILYLLYCTAAAWIMLKVDRWLYKKSNRITQQIEPPTDPQEEKCSPLS